MHSLLIVLIQIACLMLLELMLCTQSALTRLAAFTGFDWSMKRLCINGQLLKVQMWELAGRNTYRELRKSFFFNSSGFLLGKWGSCL